LWARRLSASFSHKWASKRRGVPRQYFNKPEGTDDLWQVRAEFGGDAFRLLGFWDEGRLTILANGFAKKTQ
jgi:hypothetical protein